MTHFALVCVTAQHSAVELVRPDWPDGSVIFRGADEPNLRVVGHIPSDDLERFDVLVVEPVD